MARKKNQGSSRTKLLVYFALLGAAIGIIFPLFASIFVQPRSTTAEGIFVVMCIAAGVGLGVVCAVVATRTGEKMFAEVLQTAQKDFGIAVDVSGDADAMRLETERILADVTSILNRMRMASEDVRALAGEVLAATEEQASGAAEQAAAVTETSATVEELAQTSKQIADNAQSVATIAERTLASAEEGMQAVADTADGIEEIRETTQAASDRILALGERSQEIGRVLVIIDDIAEQTKILALNAAIEAARAGEAGKGFAVVAEEIRKLADSVTDSTQEIGRVVREIQSSSSSLVMSTERAQKKVEEGKQLARRTADALDGIVQRVEETTDSAKQISIATQQQRTASDQVVISMREMAQVATQAAQVSRQIQAALTELNTLADTLVAR